MFVCFDRCYQLSEGLVFVLGVLDVVERSKVHQNRFVVLGFVVAEGDNLLVQVLGSSNLIDGPLRVIRCCGGDVEEDGGLFYSIGYNTSKLVTRVNACLVEPIGEFVVIEQLLDTRHDIARDDFLGLQIFIVFSCVTYKYVVLHGPMC